ncbi:MAG: hypothetical protein PHI23_03500 [Candidatus Peribacteraceae bacterium]|nr:hypothetical protein [Candidatus Peribacteraceae bacterium]
MHTPILQRILSGQSLKMLGLGAMCVVASFAVGIRTAGEVQPITLIEAGSTAQQGDMDGSGSIDLQDVISILEIAQGYHTPSPRELLADPNGDGQLTVDDALRLLRQISAF